MRVNRSVQSRDDEFLLTDFVLATLHALVRQEDGTKLSQALVLKSGFNKLFELPKIQNQVRGKIVTLQELKPEELSFFVPSVEVVDTFLKAHDAFIASTTRDPDTVCAIPIVKKPEDSASYPNSTQHNTLHVIMADADSQKIPSFPDTSRKGLASLFLGHEIARVFGLKPFTLVASVLREAGWKSLDDSMDSGAVNTEDSGAVNTEDSGAVNTEDSGAVKEAKKKIERISKGIAADHPNARRLMQELITASLKKTLSREEEADIVTNLKIEKHGVNHRLEVCRRPPEN